MCVSGLVCVCDRDGKQLNLPAININTSSSSSSHIYSFSVVLVLVLCCVSAAIGTLTSCWRVFYLYVLVDIIARFVVHLEFALLSHITSLL
jgi:hypothetical protein